MDTIENLKNQHYINYKNAVLENIKNNTKVLFEEDIASLLKKPPLDSMDVIKVKAFSIAKKNKTVLNVETLEKMINSYRREMIHSCKEFIHVRSDYFVQKIEKVEKEGIIKLTKKDFSIINKEIKKQMKEILKNIVNKKIVNNVNEIFTEKTEFEVKKKITDEFVKFLNGSYQRQLLENIDFKILVKDTTLMNGVKEQSEHYLFTLENSRIFQTTEE